jgi:hypothetical protein
MDCEAAEQIGFSKQDIMVLISCTQKYLIIFGDCNKTFAYLQTQLILRALYQRLGRAKENSTNPLSTC